MSWTIRTLSSPQRIAPAALNLPSGVQLFNFLGQDLARIMQAGVKVLGAGGGKDRGISPNFKRLLAREQNRAKGAYALQDGAKRCRLASSLSMARRLV